MGEIINSKVTKKNRIRYKLLLDQDEFLNLKGNMKNIFLFSRELCQTKSEITKRGQNDVTKYFQIPFNLRCRTKPLGEITYQKIETPSKIFYIYTAKTK